MQRQPIGLHFMPEGEDTARDMLVRIPMAVVKFYCDRGYLDDPRKVELLNLAAASGALVVGRRYADPMPDQSAQPEAEADRYFYGSGQVESFADLARALPQIMAWEGPNEVIIKTPVEMQWYARFCVRLANLMLQHTTRPAVLGNWASGNPEIALWQYWVPVLQLAAIGKCLLSRHSYGEYRGDMGTWHALRHRRDVTEWARLGYKNLPLILTEVGADHDGGYPGQFREVFGTDAEAIDPYWDQYLKPLSEELAKDRLYLLGACLFTTGNGMGPWNNFDTAHTPWANAIIRNPAILPATDPVAPTPVVEVWPAGMTHQVAAAVALNVREFPWCGQLTPPRVSTVVKGQYVRSYSQVLLPGMVYGWHLIAPEGNQWVSGAYLKEKPKEEVPPATPPPATYASQGVIGQAFSVEAATAGVGEPCWFNFCVYNSTDHPVNFSILAARTEEGQAAQSWTQETLDPYQTLEWRDHINFAKPGTYHLYLGIGYDDVAAQIACTAPWDRLSPSLTVVVK